MSAMKHSIFHVISQPFGLIRYFNIFPHPNKCKPNQLFRVHRGHCGWTENDGKSANNKINEIKNHVAGQTKATRKCKLVWRLRCRVDNKILFYVWNQRENQDSIRNYVIIQVMLNSFRLYWSRPATEQTKNRKNSRNKHNKLVILHVRPIFQRRFWSMYCYRNLQWVSVNIVALPLTIIDEYNPLWLDNY